MAERRVLMIVENLPVPFDRRVWLQARTLAAAGYRISVICPRTKEHFRRFERIDGVVIYRHPSVADGPGRWRYVAEYLQAHLWQVMLTAWIGVTRGFDVLHICNPPDSNVLTAAIFHLFGKRIVFDHHDLSPELYEAKFGRRDAAWRLIGLVERLAFRSAHTVISTNLSYREIALTRGGKRPEDVFVVRTGPDLEAWPAEPARDPAWRDGRRFLIGYLGVVGEQDGVDILIRAMRQIVHGAQKLDARLVVIGDGPALEAVKALAGTHELADHIAFLGRAPDATVLAALGEADVCVNPDRPSTLNDRSTMNKVMEYMALSKPIVQFETVEGRYSAGEASLYANRGDIADFAAKIVHLLQNPQLRVRMGAAGRARIENELAWRHQAPRLLAAYDHAFATGPERIPAGRPRLVPEIDI